MTVLEERAPAGVDWKRIGQYLVVALAAAAVGVGATLGSLRLAGSAELGPAEIAQARADEYVDFARNQWIAEVNATRQSDQVAFYQGLYAAQVAAIEAQRADDMVQFYADAFRARLAQIYEQRAQDMVTFRFGWDPELDG
jgi:hypothetical protein